MRHEIKTAHVHKSAEFRVCFLPAVGFFAFIVQSHAMPGGYVKNIEMHQASFTKTATCTMQLDTIHRREDERFVYVNPKAKFVFEENTAWYPCTVASLDGVCLKFDEKDLTRWNLFNSRQHGIESTALVLNGKVLSMLAGHGGVARNPLIIGQVDGSPPTELIGFLAADAGP